MDYLPSNEEDFNELQDEKYNDNTNRPHINIDYGIEALDDWKAEEAYNNKFKK
jgi:hypothetical protein